MLKNHPGYKGQKRFKGSRWISVGMNELKEIKQAVITYGLHTSFVKVMTKTWASDATATPI